MIPPLRIGARLRAARVRAGLEQEQPGDGAVAHFEADRRSPSLANFRAICVALGEQSDAGSAARVARALLGL